jgi:carbamoylphosphate synthase small subunit
MRVPGNYPFMDELDSFDGVFISNGPGDPMLYKATITEIKKALKKNIPLF